MRAFLAHESRTDKSALSTNNGDNSGKTDEADDHHYSTPVSEQGIYIPCGYFLRTRPFFLINAYLVNPVIKPNFIIPV